jgi:hypothetical protein
MDDGRVVRAGTPGADIPAELLPDPSVTLDPERLLAGSLQELGPSEVVMWKPRWCAFVRTPFEQHLDSMNVAMTTVFHRAVVIGRQ